MRKVASVFFPLTLTVLAPLVGAQHRESKTSPVPREKPLVLTEIIPLEDAKGRFDHLAMGGGRLFVAALGSNAVEVINIGGRVLDHTIAGVRNPQGVAFSPETNKLFVASGQGKVHVYDGTSYDQIAAIAGATSSASPAGTS